MFIKNNTLHIPDNNVFYSSGFSSCVSKFGVTSLFKFRQFGTYVVVSYSGIHLNFTMTDVKQLSCAFWPIIYIGVCMGAAKIFCRFEIGLFHFLILNFGVPY